MLPANNIKKNSFIPYLQTENTWAEQSGHVPRAPPAPQCAAHSRGAAASLSTPSTLHSSQDLLVSLPVLTTDTQVHYEERKIPIFKDQTYI